MKQKLISLVPQGLLDLMKSVYHPFMMKFTAYGFERDIEGLSRFVAKGDTVLDVGANIGVFAKYLAGFVGPTGRVLSFEPIPTTFRELSRNTRALGLANVTCFPVALSDKAGEVYMEVPRFPGGKLNYYMARIHENRPEGEAVVHAIQTQPLDAMAEVKAEKVSAIKFDVEGHELQAVSGGLDLIRRDTPVLLIEISGNPDDPEGDAGRLFALLEDIGYEAYSYDGSGFAGRTPGESHVNYFFVPVGHPALPGPGGERA